MSLDKKDKKNKKDKNKIGVFHSVKFRILLAVFAIVTLAVSFNNVVVVELTKKHMIDIDKCYIFDMSKASCKMLDSTIKIMGKDKALSETSLSSICSKMKIKDLDSSYTYVVSKDGTMLYHPTSSKIGQKVENAVRNQVVRDLKAGKNVKSDIVSYDYHGETKYAAYSLTSDKEAIVVGCADETDITDPIHKIIAQENILNVVF